MPHSTNNSCYMFGKSSSEFKMKHTEFGSFVQIDVTAFNSNLDRYTLNDLNIELMIKVIYLYMEKIQWRITLEG